jgi:hypothetical protein
VPALPSRRGKAAFKLNVNRNRSVKGCIKAKYLKLLLGGLHVKPAERSGICSGPRKTTENLDRVGRWQDLSDPNCLLASSPCRLPRYKNPVRTSQETHYVSVT